MIRLYLIAILSAGLITTITLYVYHAERAKSQVVVLEGRLEDAHKATRQNQAAVEACIAANQLNATEAVLQRERAVVAEKQLIVEAQGHDKKVRDIWKDSQRFSDNCPALDDSFRAWMFSR